MARLLHPPLGFYNYVTGIEPLSGPRAVNAGVTTSIGNFVQTTGSPFGLWRWRVQLGWLRGDFFRRYRGWITALHGGANATRFDLFDPDMMKPVVAGIATSECQEWENIGGNNWSNGMPWSNGSSWRTTPPTVPVSATADRDASVVSLGSAFWGHYLDVGDYLGFFPFHFGLYMVTEVIGPGTYRIWPPLRKAITSDDFATLRPTLAMRLEGEEAANAPRGAVFAEGLSVTLVEVPDYTARQWFAD